MTIREQVLENVSVEIRDCWYKPTFNRAILDQIIAGHDLAEFFDPDILREWADGLMALLAMQRAEREVAVREFLAAMAGSKSRYAIGRIAPMCKGLGLVIPRGADGSTHGEGIV
jgi:hypothetical protein